MRSRERFDNVRLNTILDLKANMGCSQECLQGCSDEVHEDLAPRQPRQVQIKIIDIIWNTQPDASNDPKRIVTKENYQSISFLGWKIVRPVSTTICIASSIFYW
jgi:hypothetical protein